MVDYDRTRKALDTAMSFDMTHVMKRYAEKTGLPDEVLAEHEREIKRFLALASVSPGRYGMRGPLDELWHTFILFTSSYARFCEALGGGFIHHLPETPGAGPREEKPEGSSYMTFLRDYEELLGELAPVELWPRPGGDVEDPSCDQCGIWCAQTCAAIEVMPEPARRY